MGISKGRGIAWAKRHLGRGGRVVVMVGDGELQEGQNYEGLQAAAHERLAGLTVVVDRNELQSDKPTDEIVSLGELEARFRAFGWHVASCDGHDVGQLRDAFESFREIGDRPQALVARTIKGKGVSFMEHPAALREGGGTYRWHAGAPDDESFERAFAELSDRISERLAARGLGALELEPVEDVDAASSGTLEGEPESGAGARRPTVTDEYVVDAYGEELVRLGAERDDLVVLDADLASDCRVRAFELAYPDRFVECGIAEQDMVSTAAGLARHGLLPVVNSFASFLASRANEQIYNQASERTKVVYALHYAGLIPAGPGKSHQSVRDISLLAALPGHDDRSAGERRGDARASALGGRGRRRRRRDPARDRARRRGGSSSTDGSEVGRGRALREGADAILLAYGPVMLHEALTASELLAERGVGLRGREHAVAEPLRRRLARASSSRTSASSCSRITRRSAGSATRCGAQLGRETSTVFGVEGWPACGTPSEALRAHGLDGASLAARIEALLGSS